MFELSTNKLPLMYNYIITFNKWKKKSFYFQTNSVSFMTQTDMQIWEHVIEDGTNKYEESSSTN